MWRFALLSLLVGSSAEQLCTSGVTLRSNNASAPFNGDYLVQYLFPSHDGGQRLIGPAASTQDPFIGPSGWLTLSPGCLGLPMDNCNDQDKQRGGSSWLLYSTTTAEAGSCVDPARCPTNTVVAICKKGCPPVKSTGRNGMSVWPAGGSFETVWELTGERGQPGTFTASVSCCQRKPQPCDGYDKCPSHNTPLGVWSFSCHKDDCCKWVYPNPIAIGGHCENDPLKTPTQCAHAAAAGELAKPTIAKIASTEVVV